MTADMLRFRLPDGAEVAAEPRGDAARPVARLKSAVLPGVYQALRVNRPQDPPEYFVVEFDRAESNLVALTDADRDLLASKERMKFIRDVADWTAAVEDDSPRAEVWWIALLAVLALLVFEVAMTRRLVRSGHGVLEPDLTAEQARSPQ